MGKSSEKQKKGLVAIFLRMTPGEHKIGKMETNNALNFTSVVFIKIIYQKQQQEMRLCTQIADATSLFKEQLYIIGIFPRRSSMRRENAVPSGKCSLFVGCYP